MEHRDIADRSAWEAFVSSQDEAQFLQSWAWGAFQQAVGRRVIRIGIVQNGVLAAACQVISMRHPLGRSSLYVPRGPIVSPRLSLQDYRAAAEAISLELLERAKRLKADYVRIESPLQHASPSAGVFGVIRGWKQVKPNQPAATLLLDLSKDESVLLAEQHQKTRYNLNLARRKGVRVRIAHDEPSIAAFLALSHETAKRDGISLHPDAYYRTMIAVLQKEGMAKLFLAESNGKILVANIVLHYGDTVTYLHGASSDEDRNVMAPFLAQWEQMRWAKQQSARWYDFWGIAPSAANEHHPWAGITRFKKGFGGLDRQYMGGRELPVRRIGYALVAVGRKLRPPR